MTLLGLLLYYFDRADVCGIADETKFGLLVIGFPCNEAFLARICTTTVVDGRVSLTPYRFAADGAAEGIVIGVDDSLERNQGGGRSGIRRHCSDQST